MVVPLTELAETATGLADEPKDVVAEPEYIPTTKPALAAYPQLKAPDTLQPVPVVLLALQLLTPMTPPAPQVS